MNVYFLFFLLQWAIGTLVGMAMVIRLLYGRFPGFADDFDVDSFQEHISSYFFLCFPLTFIIAVVSFVIAWTIDINILQNLNLAIICFIFGMVGCAISDSTLSKDKV